MTTGFWLGVRRIAFGERAADRRLAPEQLNTRPPVTRAPATRSGFAAADESRRTRN